MHVTAKLFIVFLSTIIHSLGQCDSGDYCICYCNGIFATGHLDLPPNIPCSSQTCREACANSICTGQISGICITPNRTGDTCTCRCCTGSDTCDLVELDSFPMNCTSYECYQRCNEKVPICQQTYKYGNGQLNNTCRNSRPASTGISIHLVPIVKIAIYVFCFLTYFF